MGKTIRVYEMLDGNWTNDSGSGNSFQGESAKAEAIMDACRWGGKDDFITVDYSNAQKKRAKELGLDLMRMTPKPKRREQYLL